MRYSAPAPFHGRTTELDGLHKVLSAGSKGGMTIAVVEGEAGIGKTRLIQEAVLDADRLGLETLWGACDEVDRDRPFGPVLEALDISFRSPDPQKRRVAQVLAGDDNSDQLPGGISQRYRVTESILDLLEGITAEAPRLLVLEDIHWADPSTLALISNLVKRPGIYAGVVLLTMRPLPRSQELGALITSLDARAVHFELFPLSDGIVTALAEEVLGGKLGPGLLGVLAGAAGNPLFITELLSTLEREGSIERSEVHADVAQADLPPSLRLTILRRLSFLSDETLELLKLSSVLGSTFSIEDLSIVLDTRTDQIVGNLDEALRAKVLEESGQELAFRHDLIREAIYQDLPAPVRKGLHLQAGRSLAQAHRDLRDVAIHLELGASRGDRESSKLLRKAAEELSGYDLLVSSRLLESAANLLEPTDPDRNAIRVDLVRDLGNVGRMPEAEMLARELLLSVGDPELRFDLHSHLGPALLNQGKAVAGMEALKLAAAETEVPADKRSWTLVNIGASYLFQGDLAGAEAATNEAVAFASRSGSRKSSLVGGANLAMYQALRGQAGQAVQESHRLLDEAKADGHPNPKVYVGEIHGLLLSEADRFSEAEETLAWTLRLSEEIGFFVHLPRLHTILGMMMVPWGRWDEAVTELTVADEIIEESGGFIAQLPAALLALIDLHRGDLETAGSRLRSIEESVIASGPGIGFETALWVNGLVEEASGKLDVAKGSLENAWQVASTSWPISRRVIAPDLVRVGVETGDKDFASHVVADVEQLAALSDRPGMAGLALRCRGVLQGDADMLVDAVDQYRRTPRRFELALVLREAATLLGRAGRRDEALPLLQEALALFEGLDAVRDVAQIDADLRGLGIKKGKRGRRARPQTGWPSLTDAENRVVELVIEGLMYREVAERMFISRRTVETHISHVFSKLGISSRRELARSFAERGPATNAD